MGGEQRHQEARGLLHWRPPGRGAEPRVLVITVRAVRRAVTQILAQRSEDCLLWIIHYLNSDALLLLGAAERDKCLTLEGACRGQQGKCREEEEASDHGHGHSGHAALCNSLRVGVSPELWPLSLLRGKLVPWWGFPALCLVSGDCSSHQNIASLVN